MNLITLFLTCADEAEAKAVSKKLLDEKLAACVRYTDVQSGFIWKGKQEHGSEVLLIIESIQEKFDAIEEVIKAIHTYDTFVLTAYPVVKASAGVQKWADEVLS